MADEEVFARAFGQRADMELDAWRALPADRATTALRRLSALVRLHEMPRPPLSVLAREAGMDPSNFQKLARRFEEAPNISAIAPYAGRAPRTHVPLLDEQDSLVMDVEVLLAREVPTTLIIEHVRARGQSVSAVAESTARAFVRRVAARRSLQANELKHDYGRRVVLDCTATNMAASSSGSGQLVHVCLAVEVASHRVLGFGVGDPGEAALLLVGACRFGNADRRPDDTRGSPLVSRVKIDVVLPPSPPQALSRLGARETGLDLSVVSQGQRRFGKLIVPLLGRNIGRLGLRPRFTRDDPDYRPEVAEAGIVDVDGVEHARVLIGDMLSWHNGRLMPAVREQLGDDLLAARDLTLSAVLEELATTVMTST